MAKQKPNPFAKGKPGDKMPPFQPKGGKKK